MSATSEWAELVFDVRWMQRLERYAGKRFGQSLLAEEAVSYVINELSHENWQKLRSFQGHSQQLTFLNTIAHNLVEEYSRKKFGRSRPPEWLKRKGNLWLRVWQQLCLERQSSTTVIENLSSPQREKSHLEGIIRVIRGKMPWCGVKIEEIPYSYLSSADDVEPEIAETCPDDHEQTLYEGLLLMLSALVNPGTDQLTNLPQFLIDKLENLRQSLHLESEDILILRLVYIEGMKQVLVAQSMGLEPYQLNRRIKQILKTVKEALMQVGISLDEVRAVLQN